MSNNENVATQDMVAGTAPRAIGDDRIEQFRSAVAELKLRTSHTRGDLARQVVGGILMIGGLVAGLIIYEESLSQGSALNLASEQILAIAMLAIVVIGAALFVSASLSRFLRFWMLRQLYEGQAHIDRVVESVGRGPRG